MAGSINLLVCRVPFGTHLSAIDSHLTAPTACTVLFISHPFGVIYRSPHNKLLKFDKWLKVKSVILCLFYGVSKSLKD